MSMNINELGRIMRENGIVGAGGAGFPSYAKLNEKADTIILNCAECEPLLKLHRQVLEKYAFEIMTALTAVKEATQAERVIIAVKPAYKGAVEAVKANLSSFKDISIGYLPEVYPAGDEVITIYETTGRVVAPGSIPISVGCIVYNVETMLNLYFAMTADKPVTTMYISIAGEVKKPVTLKVPLGMTVNELIELAGGVTVDDPVYISGGPMTGRICNGFDTITKTSNAILVMPKDHYIVLKRSQSTKVNVKRAMASCCQCQMCTDLCPRHLLGHPITPHMFMRSVSSGTAQDIKPLLDTMFCSACGLCEMYSCGQGLSPRTLIGEYKGALRKNGVPVPKDAVLKPVAPYRNERRVPMERLTARIGLTRYDVPAPMVDEEVKAKAVKIQLTQHIGAPAKAFVAVGDKVVVGQPIGGADDDKLGVKIHATISGTVTDVNDKFVTIKA